MKQSRIIRLKPARKQAVEQLLTRLPAMDRKRVHQTWRELFSHAPSHALRRETLIPILAYRIQEKAFGGLKQSTARRLSELAAEHTGGLMPRQHNLRPKTGTRYIREYAGQLHEVTVLESGYEYSGSTYRSLTQIAKLITGGKRSGPAFFGLRARQVAA